MRFRNSVQPFLSLLIAAFFIGVALAGKTYENYEKAEKIFILNKVCRKYAEGMQCKSLTLPYS